jgi:hypothetical protein
MKRRSIKLRATTCSLLSNLLSDALKFLTPLLPKNNYTVTVLVLGENWYCIEKSGRRSGSKGYSVSVDKVFYKE